MPQKAELQKAELVSAINFAASVENEIIFRIKNLAVKVLHALRKSAKMKRRLHQLFTLAVIILLSRQAVIPNAVAAVKFRLKNIQRNFPPKKQTGEF